MGKRALKYIPISMGLFLAIACIEIFLLNSLVDFIGTDFKTHLFVYSIFILAINPIVTKIIADKIDDKMRHFKDGV